VKKKLLIAFSASLCALIIALTPNQSVHSNTSGGPAGYTGSPLEFSGRTCGTGGGCHGGGVTDEPNWITSDIPACGYTPGQTYTITVFVTSPGRTKFGFSCSPQFPNASTAGSLIAGTGTALNGSGRYITHTSGGTAQNGTNSRTWTFQWIAPAAGAGSLTFYAAMNATNSNSSTSGDEIHKSTLVVNENIPLTIQNSGSTSFCANTSVTLTSPLSGNNTWTLNGNPIGSSNSVIANASGTYALTNTNGACVKNASIVLTEINLPVPPEITSDVNFRICPNSTIELVALSSDAITWQPGGETTPTLAINSPGNYAASATNSCGTSELTDVFVSELSLPVTPIIEADGPVEFCEGNQVVLSVSNFTFDDQVIWEPGNVSTFEITATETGTYSVQYSNSCGVSSPVEIEVFAEAIPETPVIVLNGTNLTTSVIADLFTWYLNGAEVIDEQDAVLTPPGLGVYTVQAFSDLGCPSALSEPFNFNPTNIGTPESFEFSVYPNPTCGTIAINGTGLKQNERLQIFDISGKIVLDTFIENGKITTLDLPFNEGLYLISILNQRKTFIISQ
jgi:hypothetical protein